MAEAVAPDEDQRYGVLVLGADAHPEPVDALAAAADVSVETASLADGSGPAVGDDDRDVDEGDGDGGGHEGARSGLPALLVDHDPDCVVVVHDPPAVDGLAVLAALREADRARPVVVATTPEGVTEAAAADADGILALQGGPIPPALAADRVRTAVRAAADRRPGPDEADRAEALAATYRVFAEDDRPLTDRARDLLEVARSTLGLRHARLSQLVEDGTILEDVAAVGPDIAAGLRPPTGDRGPCEAVVRTEEGLALGDVPAQEPAFATGEHAVGTYVGAPVVVDGEPWGTLCLHDPEPRRDGLDEWSVTLVDLLARWLGTLIEREASGARLESTFERMDDALFTLDRDWVVTDANEPGAAVLRGAMELPPDADPVGRHL